VAAPQVVVVAAPQVVAEAAPQVVAEAVVEAAEAAPQEAVAVEAGERSDLKPHSRDRWRAQESVWRQERVLG
jgi:hypothetical protein